MKFVMPLVLLFLIVLPAGASLQTELGYGKAITCAQKGDWKKTQDCLSSLVVDFPERLDLLYDNGVAAYRLSEFDKAAAYFQTVATSKVASNELKKQAYFNLGNSHVALNKLSDAIADYEAVLKIDPANKPAAHNLEKVRQMMQQQDKQNQQDKKSDKNKNKDDKNQDSKDQQKNKSGDGQDNKNDSSSNKKEENQKQQNGQGKENDESSGDEQKEQSSNQKQDGQKKDHPDEKSNEQDAANKQDKLRDNHDSSSSDKQKDSKNKNKESASKADSQTTKNDTKEQEIQAGAIEDNENERKKEENEQLLAQLGADKQWMARILERQEQSDQKAQKRMIKVAVDKELAGHYGQNCW